MKPLYYIPFFVIFVSRYLLVICQNVPSPRSQQTSTLVGTRLYFFGGAIPLSVSNEVWYLDLSSSFNVSTPPWHSDVVMTVRYSFGTSCLSPIDNSTIFLIGGRTWIANTNFYSNTSSVYQFNSKTSQWTTPTINTFNSSFASRNEIQAVIDNNGKIFIFGGTNYISLTSTPIFDFYNDINTLDITTMTWSTQTQSQSALPNTAYTATLLPNGLIVYIGGRNGSNSDTNIAQIQVFDTKLYTWSTKSASGSTIASRLHHSAVLTQDGNIIIYGGSTHDSSGSFTYVFSDIAVLNTNSWVWSVPRVSGTSAPPLTQHSAELYKNYMILAFGATSPSIIYTNNIYILDIQNYTWVTTFNIPTTTNQAKQTQSNGNSSTDQANNNSSNLYIGIGIEIIATPGTSKDDHIRETHISTIYTPGIPPPAKYELTPTYGVPVPGNNYHGS
ncbi:galactose oxidase [Gigaspora margarita]|uniref:Galactose oxidase n=1 Tax=Gigaspora margarita TaxID=4874 RepID=A0A8H4B057_GIGMA|nr:galactose oxidase [Gigaspora margarita]